MSLTKGTTRLDPSSSDLLKKNFVCGDPYCPKATDQYSGRIMCRCYQTGSVQPPQFAMPPNFAVALLNGAMHAELPSPVSTPITHAGFSGLAPVGYSPYPTMSPTHQNVENILRSQMCGYMYSGIDPNTGRRKNATRETTAALKAWLKEHKKNPYPTKAEKIMLAIITRMTLTQVSTWFANARRRLKKEHRGEFSSDNSYDNISTISSDDEDSIKSDPMEEGGTPEHELPGYSAISREDMYNYASFSFFSQRPLTSTPIDHNMNTLPCYAADDKHFELTNLKKDSEAAGKCSGSKESNSDKTLSQERPTEEEQEHSIQNLQPERPKFLPPLISRPKIWSISNIIGNTVEEKEPNSENKIETI